MARNSSRLNFLDELVWKLAIIFKYSY